MKNKKLTARKILETLHTNCCDFAALELACINNRSTERDDYFRAKGSLEAYRHLKWLIWEYIRVLDRGETTDETND